MESIKKPNQNTYDPELARIASEYKAIQQEFVNLVQKTYNGSLADLFDAVKNQNKRTPNYGFAVIKV